MSNRATAAPFPATRWSVVLSARKHSSPAQSLTAMEDLCRLYWRPLYAFARGNGLTPEDAADRTQDFFSKVIVGQDLLAAAEPCLGKLRTFLLTAFRHDILDALRKDRRQKRGAGNIVPLDLAAAEAQLAPSLTVDAQPARLFEKSWAQSVILTALDQLAQAYAADGKTEIFLQLRPFISLGPDNPASYEELSGTTGLSKSTLRQNVHRLRSRFRETIRTIIADTLNDPTDAQIDEELQSLQIALRQ